MGAVRLGQSRATDLRAFVSPGWTREGDTLTIRLPLKTVGEQNQREHWAIRNKRRAEQQALLSLVINSARTPALPVVVTFARIAPRPLDDDNRVGSFKHLRDGLAAWLGLPKNKRGVAQDSDPRVRWRYSEDERNEGVRLYGVEIRIEPMPAGGGR